jgi:ABC-type transport system involved in multi-copper enzyme maturation permease subunit
MTAQSMAAADLVAHRPRGGMFLGFTTVLRKEITEWFKGPKALIVAGVSIVAAIFTTVIPFIVKATNQAAQTGAEGSQFVLTLDPTTNVLLGWAGQTVPLIAVVATMALMSTERDRGTLAWTLTNPVSPTSVIAAKFAASMLVFGVAAVILPIVVSIGVATVVYGALPNLAIVGTFAVLFLALPAFYIALTIGLGTFVKTTAGVAGIAFAVMFLPQILGGLMPVINEVAPTSIGAWAIATAKGEPASMLTLAGWVVSMAVIVIGSKLVFDRQEL